uniref:Uncharacterized protein n=1 Tax=Amphimedon queenslandica TaxID=400682 RepID=A0A1X7VQF9_AMPQE
MEQMRMKTKPNIRQNPRYSVILNKSLCPMICIIRADNTRTRRLERTSQLGREGGGPPPS